jgi:hypothetical protein
MKETTSPMVFVWAEDSFYASVRSPGGGVRVLSVKTWLTLCYQDMVDTF